MTCVVGIAKGRRVYLGADSIVVYGQDVIQSDDVKVWSVGPFVIGVAGAAEWWDLLRDRVCWDRIAQASTNESTFRKVLRSEIRGQARDDGMDLDDEGVEGDTLIGVAGRLYRFDNYGTCQRIRDHFEAIGSGAGPARGSLYSTQHDDKTPRQRLLLALESAERYTTTVRRPWRWAEG